MSARVDIRVQPKASRERIVGLLDGALKVAVTAPPEKGKANKAVAQLLAKSLGVPPAAVSVVVGATGRRKQVAVDGLTQEQLNAWLARQGQA